MIRFRLYNEHDPIWVSASAFIDVRFVAGRLCRDRESTELAALEHGEWQVCDRAFENISFEEAVMVRLQNDKGTAGRLFGPFADFRTRDGSAFANGKLFARYDSEKKHWRHEESAGIWSTLLVRNGDPASER